MQVKIKKVSPDAVIPQYALPGDAGLDLVAVSEKIVDEPGYGYIEYDTGLIIEIPPGYVGLIFPRSSISNTGMILANSVGVIDSGYRNTIKCRFKWIKYTEKYNVGDRIAQLVILPYPQITFVESELSDSERGDRGFGSTN